MFSSFFLILLPRLLSSVRRTYCSAAAAENDLGSTIQRVVGVCNDKRRQEHDWCLSTKGGARGLIHVVYIIYTPYESSILAASTTAIE